MILVTPLRRRLVGPVGPQAGAARARALERAAADHAVLADGRAATRAQALLGRGRPRWRRRRGQRGRRGRYRRAVSRARAGSAASRLGATMATAIFGGLTPYARAAGDRAHRLGAGTGSDDRARQCLCAPHFPDHEGNRTVLR